jgi:hypothetical protein
MSPLLIKISKDFATLWTTIDPIGRFSAAEVAGRGSFALANQAILRQTWLNYEIP